MGPIPFNSNLALNAIKRIENKADLRASMSYLPQPSSRQQLIAQNYNERASAKALITSIKFNPQEKTSFVKKKGDISEKIINENLYI